MRLLYLARRPSLSQPPGLVRANASPSGFPHHQRSTCSDRGSLYPCPTSANERRNRGAIRPRVSVGEFTVHSPFRNAPPVTGIGGPQTVNFLSGDGPPLGKRRVGTDALDAPVTSVTRHCSSTRGHGQPLGKRRVGTDALDAPVISVTRPSSSTRGDGQPLARGRLGTAATDTSVIRS
jgi:hypothetical protein